MMDRLLRHSLKVGLLKVCKWLIDSRTYSAMKTFMLNCNVISCAKKRDAIAPQLKLLSGSNFHFSQPTAPVMPRHAIASWPTFSRLFVITALLQPLDRKSVV